MVGVEPAHVCAAEPHLRKLRGRDLEATLSALSPSSRTDCLRAAGLRPRATLPLERVAKLLAARLRSLDGPAVHNVAAALTDPARAQLLHVVGEDEERLVEDVARGLEGPLGFWPRPLLAALIALLGELGAYPASARDQLLDLLTGDLDQDEKLTADPDDGPPALPAEPIAPPLPPPLRSVVDHASNVVPRSASSALEVVLTEVLLREHAQPTGPTLDVADQAVDELLSLDGRRPEWWRLRGLADGLTAAPLESDSPAPPTPELAQQKLVGLLEALVYRGRGDDVAELVRSVRGAIARLVRTSARPDLFEPMFTALLERDPMLARELLMLVTRPFPQWRDVIDGIRRAGAHLAAQDPVAAGSLLRAGDDMLTAWTPDLSHDDLAEVERAAAGLAVERVSCQRRAADFRGARSLLGRIDPRVLSRQAHGRLLDEAALVAASVSSLHVLVFPEGSADRELASRRLGQAKCEIEAAVEGGSGVTGRVLRAVGAVAAGEHGNAVADLRAVCGTMSEEADLSIEDRRMLAKLEFQLGLSELCLLEPEIVATAMMRIEQAMVDGHLPSTAELCTTAVALDALGSSEATTMVGRALASSPGDEEALDLLTGMAKRAVRGATAMAAERGSDVRLRRRVRFELLDAALSGVGSGNDEIDVEVVVDEIERLVAKAADIELDRRWADRLGSDEAMRSALGSDALDLVRLSVLRRSGCIDEAASVARLLFYRSLSGHVEGVDAGDLLELLGQLGVDEGEMQSLGRMLPSDNLPAATSIGGTSAPRRVVVLFVGGNETQSRARPAVERTIAASYGDSVTVEWYATGWSSNWGPAASEIESRFAEADVMILMTFVRTMLGRRLRRTAGDAGVPWVACTGHGRASIERAIDRAVLVSRLRTEVGPPA